MHFVQGREEPMAVPSSPRPPVLRVCISRNPLWLCVLCWTKPTLPAPVGAAEPPQPELATLIIFIIIVIIPC